jgi:hypothetical protein
MGWFIPLSLHSGAPIWKGTLHAKINSLFHQLGFKCCEYDHRIYVRHTHGLIVVVYVDDLQSLAIIVISISD